MCIHMHYMNPNPSRNFNTNEWPLVNSLCTYLLVKTIPTTRKIQENKNPFSKTDQELEK